MTDTIAIQIKAVTKYYGAGTDAVRALHNINIDIRHNEFFTLLGPSGCGKTTLLRTIGGFEDFQKGEISLYGQSIKGLPANKRSVNTVFQHYALFPHKTIIENIGFGLKMLGKPESEIQKRSNEMLELVKLNEYAHRKPAQLSGGQQQRVALARALAPAPKVLLLDEPLSALDLKLRQAMRHELRHIQEALGITFIFVTHDQQEALTMSDRVAVMSQGELQQVGPPEDIYNSPANVFVADFIGETNLIPVIVEKIDDGRVFCTFDDHETIQLNIHSNLEIKPGQKGRLSIRPEHMEVCAPDSDSHHFTGTVIERTFLGNDAQVVIQTAGGTDMIARLQLEQWKPGKMIHGETVGIRLKDEYLKLLMH